MERSIRFMIILATNIIETFNTPGMYSHAYSWNMHTDINYTQTTPLHELYIVMFTSEMYDDFYVDCDVYIMGIK